MRRDRLAECPNLCTTVGALGQFGAPHCDVVLLGPERHERIGIALVEDRAEERVEDG
jgi:hypothetical protein